MKIISSLPYYIIFLFACTTKKPKAPVIQPHVQHELNTEKKLSIRKAGVLHFRRSYAANQFRELSAREYKKIENSNPTPDIHNNKELMKAFQDINLVDKRNALNRNQFKFQKNKNFELIGQDGKVNCRIARPGKTDRPSKYNLIISWNNQEATIEIDGEYGMLNADIKYLFLDIIPGGYQEIIVLNEYYIMMGDNSDLYIYEFSYGL